MNAIDRFFLRLFLLPQRLYAAQGVNILHLRAILTAKLTMDNRRVLSVMAQRQQQTKKQYQQQAEVNNSTRKTMWAAFFMGLILLFSLLAGHDALTRLTMYCTLFIFMLCMTLITDFTTMLIDTRDNLILLPKPVSDKTFLLARLLHIGIRVSLLLMPMALPGCIAFVLMEGLWVLAPFLLVVLLMTIFSIFLINALYLLILKLTTPDKFKSIITAIQIIFAVLVFASYQLFPRLMSSDVMRNVNLDAIFWIRFYPPYWFSEACLFLSGKLSTPQSVIGLLLAILVPVVSIWAVVRFLAPAFTQKLTLITGSVEEKRTRYASARTKGFNLKTLFCKGLTKRGTDRAGFLFTWDMMARSKDFKMRVLPQFGYILVFFVIFYLQKQSTDSFLIMLIYFSSGILTGSIYQVSYSEKNKASWLFHVTPIKAPGLLIGGSVKAILAMFYLPIAVFLLVLGLVFLGPSGLVSIVMGVLNVLAIALLQAYLNYRYLPFSRQMDGTSNGGGFIRVMMTLLPMAVLGIMHYFLRDITWALAILLLISAVASWLLYKKITSLEWDDLKE